MARVRRRAAGTNWFVRNPAVPKRPYLVRRIAFANNGSSLQQLKLRGMPMRLAFAVLALALTSLPSARAQAADWQTFTPAGGGFQVEMPGKPTLKSENRNGRKTDTALVAIDKATAGANLVFMVKYQATGEAPGPEAPDLLKAVVKAMASGNKLISDDEDEIGGFPARKFVMEDTGKDTYQVRAVITDRYFIQVMFLGPPGNELGDRFLDSFAIE
jgi:hypothetical protein